MLGKRRIFAAPYHNSICMRVEGGRTVSVAREVLPLHITRSGRVAIPFHDSITIHAVLNKRCPKETRFEALRLRAFIHVLWSGALGVQECLALDLDQVLEPTEDGEQLVRATCVLRPDQRCDKQAQRHVEVHEFPVDPDARKALLAYVRAAKRKGWLHDGGGSGPVFVASRGQRGEPGHGRWSKRALESAWHAKRANMRNLKADYSFHDFKHDAILRHVGSAEEKSRFGRVRLKDVVQMYSNPDPDGFIQMRAAIIAEFEKLQSEFVSCMKSVRCAIYLRVSTRDQRYVQQFRELHAAVEQRGWRIVRVFREKRSGAAGVDRPAWRDLCHEAQLRRFTAVAAWSLDRLGRSALDILTAVENFDERGVRLLVLRDSIETGGPSGRLIVTVLAGVAQLERDLISERTRMGMRAARIRGSKIGRPRAYVSPRDLDDVRNGRRTAASLAREVGVAAMTVRRRLWEVA